MRRKQLLFSKREKAEKATTTGESNDNPEGLLGVPKDNSKNSQNNQEDNISQLENSKNNENRQQIEKVSNEEFNDQKAKKKSSKSLKEELDKLKEELIKERNDSVSTINDLNYKNEEKLFEIKTLSNEFNKMIQQLKEYEKNLVIKTRISSRNKTKSEKEIQKEIKITEAQIKKYEERAIHAREEFETRQQRADIEMNKENNLNIQLNDLNDQIKAINDDIEILRIISNNHLNCRNENRKLIEKLANLNTAYKYEQKKAKHLGLVNRDKKGEEDNFINEEYDQLDDKGKAEQDERNLLPKIKILKFRGEKLQKLEMKIIRKNKIGLNKSSDNGNAIKCYRQLNTDYNDNDRYKKEANLNIRIGRNKEMKIEENLFNENEEKIMEKMIPENMFNSYKSRYFDLLQQKSQIREKLNTESNLIKNENQVIANKCDYNLMEIKSTKMNNLKLTVKSQKLRDRINNLNQQIKELQKEINKENKKIKEKINDERRINLYFQKMQQNKEG